MTEGPPSPEQLRDDLRRLKRSTADAHEQLSNGTSKHIIEQAVAVRDQAQSVGNSQIVAAMTELIENLRRSDFELLRAIGAANRAEIQGRVALTPPGDLQ